MKEVKNKDKNRQSCCERYVRDFMIGTNTLEYIVKKMKVNPQLIPLVENKLTKTRRQLINIPVELWSTGDHADCVSYVLGVNVRYAHIAQYLNAVHKGKVKGERCVPDGEFRGHKVLFDYDVDTCELKADFVEDGVTIKSIKNNVTDIKIN